MNRVIASKSLQRLTFANNATPSMIRKRSVNVNRTLKHPKNCTNKQGSSKQNWTVAWSGNQQQPSHFTALQDANRLTWSEARSVMVASSIPMIGFGFMDNLVMIQAGGLIDSTLGVQFGLATLTAAAMGQVVSDTTGVLFGGSLERLTSPWVKPPTLTAAQLKLPIIGRLRMAGAVGGVILGCMLGATSLYFVLDDGTDSDQSETVQKHPVVMMRELMHDMLEAETSFKAGTSCTLHVNDNQMGLKSFSSLEGSSPTNLVSVVGLDGTNPLAAQCAQFKQVVKGDDYSVLYIPVALSSSSGQDNVQVVFQLKKTNAGAFTDAEEQAAVQMARHICIFLKRERASR